MKIKPAYYCSTEAVFRRCSVKKDVCRNSAKFTGKHLCRSLSFNKVASSLLVNVLKFLRAPILKNWSNGRNWRKTCEANLGCLLSIKVFESALKAFLKQLYLKAVKSCHHDKLNFEFLVTKK